MNGQERKWFEELRRDRLDSRKTLLKPSMSGVQRSVVEKYSDEAHFIYELLQNADDARATQVKFILENDKLIFIHNGTRHFSISDPQKEGVDKENKCLGDINAITSVGNSSKGSEATIGKFGVGFKAVFQYTSTPCIYDDNFRFRIDNLIVPTLLNSDHPYRYNGSTLFEFPFNHESRSEDVAYNEIKDKLKNLNHPTLFLENLKSVMFECNDAQVEYKKSITEEKIFDLVSRTYAQRIVLTEPSGLVELWLFKRKNESLDYCVAFRIMENRLVPIKEPAYCYFPTQVDTGLNFIIHAAFLLTDSREGIKAGDEYNIEMINKLAELAADSIVYLREISEKNKIKLIDENILEIIPIQEPSLRYIKDRISFNPFYEKIQLIMCKERVLPTRTGYTSKEHAYWAETPDIMKLFSDEQLIALTKDSEAAWVFPTKGSKSFQQANRTALSYIRYLYNELITDTDQSIFNKLNINPSFVHSQPIEWFKQLYRWLCEDRDRKKRARKHKLFINNKDKVVSMIDGSGKDCLFLPFHDLKLSYSVDDASLVLKRFVADNDIIGLLKELGIREYSKRDYVYKLLKEKKEYVDDLISVTKLIFDYYCECTIQERHAFLSEYNKELHEFQWLIGYNEKDDNYDESVSDRMYYPTPELVDYFKLYDKDKVDCIFVRYGCSIKSRNDFLYRSEYIDVINNRELLFVEFLKSIGFSFFPKLKYESISYGDAILRELPIDHSKHSKSYSDSWTETRLIGCVENINFIVDDGNPFESRESRSLLLWKILSDCISFVINDWCGIYKYYGYRKQTPTKIQYQSLDVMLLREQSWLLDINNNFVSAKDTTRQMLSSKYERNDILLSFLEIRSDEERYNQLTDEERDSIEIGKRIKTEGVSKDELEQFLNERKRKMNQDNSNPDPSDFANTMHEQNCGDKCNTGKANNIPNCNKQSNQVRSITNDIETRVDKLNSKKSNSQHSTDVNSNNTELQSLEKEECFDEEIEDFDVVDEEDYDDYNPRIVDYQKKREKEINAAAIRVRKIQKLETLQNNARNAIRYSFEWFKTLLEIEMNNQSEDVNRRQKIAISFGKIEREPNTERTYILRFPNRYIPSDIEELSGFPMSLRFGKQSRDNIIVEVASIRSFTLRVKLKDVSQIADIPLDKVHEVYITADSPEFLLRELYNGFKEICLSSDYDMRYNLTPHIEFVYGPPGTGKTTYLCNNYLIDWLTGSEDYKVLVLAPTNKSADVIVNRLMSIMAHEYDDCSYQGIIRFGSTLDEQIEKVGIYKDRMFEFNKRSRAIVVTTIARFPYDYFIQRDSKIYLKDIPWDFIVIDEASMIPLVNIIYPLYKSKPKKFVIAGDPFQIQPVVTSEIWKDENIYTLVELKSFTCSKTIPHDYYVQTLNTQYRSIPCIGELFNRLTYDGVLNHKRMHDSIKQLNLLPEIDLRPLTIVKFPISKYDSIYKCKRLNNSSPYHVYSALFAYEFSNWLSKKLLEHNPDTHYSVGIISPYKIQASLVDRLLARTEITDNVDIQAGTIHSFQGDECDIVIALFNPPPSISSACFLNNLNIINVAISRARDYLIMVMPDDKTENVSNLRLIKQLEKLMTKSDKYVCYSASDIEQIMFDNPHFLEDNSFSTNHQSVNVYAKPERKYEVRCEDSAVDIQIRMETSEAESDDRNTPQKI